MISYASRIYDGIVNSADSDRTAVRSGSALFVQAYLSKDLESLRYSLKFNRQNVNILDLYFSEADWLITLL